MIIRDKCIFRRRIIVSNIVIISPYQIFLLSFFNPMWPVLQLSVSKAEIYKLGSDPGVVQDLDTLERRQWKKCTLLPRCYWLVYQLFLLACEAFVRTVFNDILVKLNVIRWKLRRQGIRGPPPSFVTGNIPEMRRIMSMAKAPSSESPPPHDFSSPRIFLYFSKWTKQYGIYSELSCFLFWPFIFSEITKMADQSQQDPHSHLHLGKCNFYTWLILDWWRKWENRSNGGNHLICKRSEGPYWGSVTSYIG